MLLFGVTKRRTVPCPRGWATRGNTQDQSTVSAGFSKPILPRTSASQNLGNSSTDKLLLSAVSNVRQLHPGFRLNGSLLNSFLGVLLNDPNSREVSRADCRSKFGVAISNYGLNQSRLPSASSASAIISC